MENYQNAKPILFNTEMVKAVLEGRKTVTRRVVKAEPPYSQSQLNERWYYRSENEVAKLAEGGSRASVGFWTPYSGYVPHKKPQYQLGDILYVRETWQYIEGASGHGFAYRAGGGVYNDVGKWRPAIHMPKSAARIFLRIKSVRAERLQDITEEQAIKEGVTAETNNSGCIHRAKFQTLWNSTIKKSDIDKYEWNANPWVWVYDFERVEEWLDDMKNLL